MKKILLGSTSLLALFGLASCGANVGTSTTSIVSSSNVNTSTSTTEITTTTGTTTNPTTTSTTTQTTNPTTTTTTNTTTTTTTETYQKVNTTVYMVGDSTMCSFSDSYYFPRYGYGTQMNNYFDTNYVTFNNLAISGRSSLSFQSETNYSTFKNNIKAGDYLIIGFGHNDEKSAETARFRNAKYDSIDEAMADVNSFQYSIYEKYAKVALDKGAYPIIASPVVRYDSSNSYTGSVVHDCGNIGDYRQACEDVATKYNIPFIDLTTLTKTEYQSLGKDEAIYYHAMKHGVYTDDTKTIIEPKLASVDATHLNIYGAKFVSYSFANALKDTSSNLRYYVKDNITKPTKANDLKVNTSYVPQEYNSNVWSTYSPSANFATTSAGYYGTVFGNLGGSTKISNFQAKETSSGVFSIGAEGNFGKFDYKNEQRTAGFAYVFKQLEANKNYTITANAKIISTTNQNQTGFGLMIRDDCYVPTDDSSILSNLMAAGIIRREGTPVVNFSIENGEYVFDTSKTTSALQANNEYTFKIERIGQTIKLTTTIDSKDFVTSETDFDIFSIDTDYYYLGMFSTRGTVVEFTNVSVEYTGEAQSA